MSKKNQIKTKTEQIISIDRNKIREEAKKNENKTSIINDCEKFCTQYNNIDFNLLNIGELRDICEQGTGLLNNYFIINEPIKDNTIIKLENIVMNANYVLTMKQIAETRQETAEITQQTRDTMRKIKHVENDIKTIISVIISIVLAISIVPTAIAGIEKVSANYILPFLASVVLFGMIMITFVYSIYQDHLKKSTCFILILGTIICVGLWIFSFNINIEVATRQASVITEQSEKQVNN